MADAGCYECGKAPGSERGEFKKCEDCGKFTCLGHSVRYGGPEVPHYELVNLCIPCYQKM